MSKKHTIEEVREIASKHGYELVSTEYKNNSSELIFSCKKHGNFSKTLSAIMNNTGCPTCSREKVGNKHRYSLEDVRRIAAEHGYKLLSTEYHKTKDTLEFECSKHGNFKTKFRNISVFHRGCPDCFPPSRKKFSIDDARRIAAEHGYTLLSDTYVRSDKTMTFVCPVHGNFDTTLISINQGHICPHCDDDSRRGSNSVLWRNGTTELYTELRRLLTGWAKRQRKRVGNKCEITGKFGKIVVHHMTPMFEIFNKTMSELNIDVREKLSDYTNEEIKIISNRFIENNEKTANPVCMLEEIHWRFHSFCGGTFMPTSFEQLEQFKKMLRDEQNLNKKAG